MHPGVDEPSGSEQQKKQRNEGCDYVNVVPHYVLILTQLADAFLPHPADKRHLIDCDDGHPGVRIEP